MVRSNLSAAAASAGTAPATAARHDTHRTRANYSTFPWLLQFTSLPISTASKFEAVAALVEGDVEAAQHAMEMAEWDTSLPGTAASGATLVAFILAVSTNCTV